MKANRIHHLAALIISIAAVAALSSCSTPKVGYFQDMPDGQNIAVIQPQKIRFESGDQLSIYVNSKDPELARMFNLSVQSRRLGQTSSSGSADTQSVISYTVDSNGEIDFPLLGKIKIAGLTREEVAQKIKNELISRHLIGDPVVSVDFGNLYFTVLGDVNKPGRYPIVNDKVTVLDAIGTAGDLTIYGLRDEVYLMREENGVSKSYKLDLTNGQELYASPAFYLKQGDVIYVNPNDTKARQSTVNGNNVRSTSFWLSVSSVLTSIAVLIISAVK